MEGTVQVSLTNPNSWSLTFGWWASCWTKWNGHGGSAQKQHKNCLTTGKLWLTKHSRELLVMPQGSTFRPKESTWQMKHFSFTLQTASVFLFTSRSNQFVGLLVLKLTIFQVYIWTYWWQEHSYHWQRSKGWLHCHGCSWCNWSHIAIHADC